MRGNQPQVIPATGGFRKMEREGFETVHPLIDFCHPMHPGKPTELLL